MRNDDVYSIEINRIKEDGNRGLKNNMLLINCWFFHIHHISHKLDDIVLNLVCRFSKRRVQAINSSLGLVQFQG